MPVTHLSCIDERITNSCFFLADWSLSRVFLKNNAHYPWFILVPRDPKVRAIDELSPVLRYRLMDEIHHLSSIVRQQFQPDHLNVGALGNVVPQLHVHVVARFTHDALWPEGLWQQALIETPYTETARDVLLDSLRSAMRDDVVT